LSGKYCPAKLGEEGKKWNGINKKKIAGEAYPDRKK